MNELEVAVDPGFKESLGRCFGNSFREAVPLRDGAGNLGSWFLKPSQPQRIISGLRETFIQRYIVERTSKAGIRPLEQTEKARSCRESLWNKIQLKGP